MKVCAQRVKKALRMDTFENPGKIFDSDGGHEQ